MYRNFAAFRCGRPIIRSFPHLVIMKTFLLLTVAFTQLAVASRAQEVSLKVRNAPISQILYQLSQQSGYDFVYDAKLLENIPAVTMNVNQVTVQSVLEQCFAGQSLTFVFDDDKTVVIKKRPQSSPKTIVIQETITGTVRDSLGNTLAGVSVLVRGTSSGAATDAQGRFQIQAAVGDILEFSALGYATKTVTVTAGQQAIVVQLISQLSDLDEVVVVGYGTVKKSDLTGSVSSVSGDKLTESAAFSAVESMQGKAAGVVIQQSTAQPGVTPQSMIRCNRSLTATNEPLYVVDGIALVGGLDDINQQNIEASDILKDASATAIYGSRGANGVVLITTKRGKSGKAIVEYNGYYGIQEAARVVELFDAAEWVDFMREAYRTAGLYPEKPTFAMDMLMMPLVQETDPTGIAYKIENAYDSDGTWRGERLQTTDWMGEVLRRGHTANQEVSVRGGTDKLKTILR